MHDSIKVARWEIKKNITSKMFIFMTFVFPILILLVGGIAGYFGSQNSPGDMNIGLVDETGFMYQELQENIKKNTNFDIVEISSFEVNKAQTIIDNNNLDGILVIPAEVVEKNQVIFYTGNFQNLNTEIIKKYLNTHIIKKRLENQGYASAEIMSLIQEVNIISRASQKLENGLESMILPFGLAMFMVLASIFSGSALMQGIIKEKNNRVVEMLFSAITARDLMYGKVLGYGILGLGQIIIWVIAGLTAGKYFLNFSFQSLLEVKSIYMLIFFLLGFIMVAGLNAIAGASVKGGEGGSQASLSSFIGIIPVVPLWLLSVLISNPEGSFSKILTYIPFFTPTTMLLRLGISAPGIEEIIAAIILLLVFDYILIRLAGKIFRVGMLMYGKKITFKEILRWVKI